MTPGVRSWRLRLAVMWAFKCRRPTLPCLSLPVPVTLTRFLTLLLVLFFVAMRYLLRAGERRKRRLVSPRHRKDVAGALPRPETATKRTEPGRVSRASE